MATVQSLINAALVALGEMSPGQTASPEESRAALAVLNDLLSAWTAQHRRVYVIDNQQFPLTPGKPAYTLGPGGDFNSFRPAKIERANVVRYETNDEIGLVKPLELASSQQWSMIAEKGMTAIQPLRLYNDNAYPVCTLHLWPVPLCS
jgi:hypothetical protein